MWKLAQDEKITIFGLSASYVNYLRSEGIRPGKDYDLSSLKEISQTGSPLSAEGFEYIYKEIKEDLHFNSIAGGTDINGCFAIGSPIKPVYAGELQSPGLGMKIKAYDEKGKPIWDQQGELVCEAPAPSMPLYFWNDPNGEKYKSAYFEHYPNVWRHGDYVVMYSDTGGVTFYGRSDAVLKPSGVRIGTAEIYNVVEKMEGIADSLAIGQNWEGDQRIILFVKLNPGRPPDGRVERQDQEDPARKGLSPPCPGDHHGDAGCALHPEHEEGGERRHQYHPRKAGFEQGRPDRTRRSWTISKRSSRSSRRSDFDVKDGYVR